MKILRNMHHFFRENYKKNLELLELKIKNFSCHVVYNDLRFERSFILLNGVNKANDILDSTRCSVTQSSCNLAMVISSAMLFHTEQSISGNLI